MPHKVEKKPKETVFPSARGECQVINTQETNWGIRGKFKRETDKSKTGIKTQRKQALEKTLSCKRTALSQKHLRVSEEGW